MIVIIYICVLYNKGNRVATVAMKKKKNAENRGGLIRSRVWI